ncbi:MAG: PKD domain-containing protein, partial [Bacteroidetes bacterium]|nr:PKD domain-containing protein [Bacteroidota bacterium]
MKRTLLLFSFILIIHGVFGQGEFNALSINDTCVFSLYDITQNDRDGQNFVTNQVVVNIFGIPEIGARLQLINAIQQDKELECYQGDQPGRLIVYSKNPEQIQSSLLGQLDELEKQLYADFKNMSKEELGYAIQDWKQDVKEELYYFILGDREITGFTCAESDPFCTSEIYSFPAATTGVGEPGPDYGCLNTQPCPVWYHMRIRQSGDITIKMVGTRTDGTTMDIDFALWGPYDDPLSPCPFELTSECSGSPLGCPNNTQNPNFYPSGNLHDCSYSGNSIEFAHVTNGQVGQYFILLITNYSQAEGNITFQKTEGDGETDCTIVPPQVSNNGPLCVGDTLELYATAEPGATYEWSGPLGFTSTDQNPIIPDVTLAHAGDYQAVVTVDGLVSDPAITTVVVNPNPVPAFTFTPDTLLCVDENILFTATSTETIASWAWDFGNGDFGSGQNINYAYPADGNFNVDLLVTTTENCQANVNQAIVIHPLPMATFTVTPGTTVCTGVQLTFNASGTTTITDWNWDFGDGNFGAGQNISHQYTTSGQKEVVLVVINDNTCSDTVSQFINVNLTPTVDFTMAPGNTLCSDEVLLLDGTANTAITSWNWNFGDGNIGTGQSVVHQYNTFGIKTVNLQVVSNMNCPSGVSHPVTVFEAPVASMLVSVGDTSCLGNSIQFTGASTTNITNWNWNFGDLSTGSGQVVNHTYASPGHYDVTLIAINSNNCNDTVSTHLFVSDVPLADFTVAPNDTSCMGELINLDATGTSDIVDWQWQFGNGVTATGQYITYAYPGAGVFEINSIYTNSNGCADTATHTQTVVDMSALAFTLTPSPSCQNFPVDFNGIGVADFTSWNWDFGDGNGGTGHDLVYTYPQPGTYDVTLNVCSEQAIQELVVNATCFAYAGVGDSTCEDVPFTITTADAGSYSALLWTHNSVMGGTIINANTLTPTYQPAPGEYETIVTLTLTASGIPPCVDQTSSMDLFIGQGSYADAGTDEDACVGVPYDFQNSTRPPQEFNGEIINWTKVNPAIDPTGYFVDPHVEVPVYVVGDYDPLATYPITLVLNMEVISPIRCRESDNMVLTIKEFHPGSVVSGNQTICYNTIPAPLQVMPPTGVAGTFTCQWQSSTDNITFTDIPGATNLVYQAIAPLTQTTYYKNIQFSNCESAETPVITVIVYDEFIAGAISPDEVICFNFQPQLLTAEVPTGGDGIYSYQWQSSIDNVTFTDIPGATSLSYQPGLLIATRYYRMVQTSGCSSVITNIITIFVLDELLPGTVSADQVICYNTQPTILSADAPTGGDGNYTYQWQNSEDNITFTDIAGATSLDYQPGLLVQTTYYRQNQICICGTVTTATITVNVHPDFNVGFITGDQTICYNTIPGIMLLGTIPTGGDGTYTYQWQESTNNIAFADIPGAILLDYQPGALTTTTYYRQVQTSGSGCGEMITNTVTITVYDEFLVGAIASNQVICKNALPEHFTTIPPTGADGNYSYQWEKSTGGDPFVLIAGATGLVYQETIPLVTTTEYRQFQTSNCDQGYTNTILVQVTTPPTVSITADMDIACVDANITFLGSSTSNIIDWEWDFDDGTTYNGQNPPPHSYGSTGYYNIILTVTDDMGCNNSDTNTVYVLKQSVVDFNYTIDSCLTVQFADLSTPPPGYYLVEWYWEFGDDSVSTWPDP